MKLLQILIYLFLCSYVFAEEVNIENIPSSGVVLNDTWDLKKIKLNDIKAEFDTLSKNRVFKKDKYETQDEYINRVKPLIPEKNIIFKSNASFSSYKPEIKELQIYKDNLSNYLVFDDRTKNKPADILLTVKESSKKRYYDASNSFGSSVTVAEYKESYHVIEIARYLGFGTILIKNGMNGPIGVPYEESQLYINMPVASTFAKKIGEDYSIYYFGVIREPFFSTYTMNISPTYSRPTKIDAVINSLMITLNEIWIVSNRTKEILVKYRQDKNIVNPKYEEYINVY